MGVFAHHAVGPTGHRSGLARLLWEGSSGVTFFFVLSGFVLSWSHAERLSQHAPGVRTRFYAARFARIYPLVLLVFAIAAAPSLAERLRMGPGALLPGVFQLTLTQAFVPVSDPLTGVMVPLGFDAPAWSLSCEAFFYALFPFFAVVLWRLRRPVMLLACAATLALLPLTLAAGLHARPRAVYWVLYIFPPSRLADFLVGACLGLAALRIRRRTAAATWPGTLAEGAALGALGIAVLCLDHVPLAYRYDAYYLPVMAAVVFTLGLERGRISRVLGHRALVFLGEISFAFYLLHTLVMRDCACSWWLSLTVSLTLSVVVFRAYEMPARRRITRGFARRERCG